MTEFKNFRVCPVCGSAIFDENRYNVVNEDAIVVIVECNGIVTNSDQTTEDCKFRAVAILKPGDFKIDVE